MIRKLKLILWCFLTRSISKPTPEGIKVLEALNITDVFDLRSNSETERRGTL
jgi:hypothetical protein